MYLSLSQNLKTYGIRFCVFYELIAISSLLFQVSLNRVNTSVMISLAYCKLSAAVEMSIFC